MRFIHGRSVVTSSVRLGVVLDWSIGLEYWIGVLDWSIGLEYWIGVLDWSIGLEYWIGRIVLSNRVGVAPRDMRA